ncbi:ankyrin repeat domain-containing protein [Candidatus Babeliales bacterium]|nr:ankyrin repeat domain-containing protein [Candidatus Babeliales bacterium]
MIKKISTALSISLLLASSVWAATFSLSPEERENIIERELDRCQGPRPWRLLSNQEYCKHIAKPRMGVTPLHVAAKEGYTEVISTLVQQECNIDAVDWGGETPLHYAAFWGKPEAFDLLIELGAHRYAGDKKGRLAWPERQMLRAAQVGDLEQVQQFYRCGVSLEAYMWDYHNKVRLTVLHLLVLGHHYEALRWVCVELKKRFRSLNPTCGDNYAKWTPLHYAEYLCDEQAQQILREFKADVRYGQQEVRDDELGDDHDQLLPHEKFAGGGNVRVLESVPGGISYGSPSEDGCCIQ